MLHREQLFTRESLYNRHILSHHQIDDWIGTSEKTISLNEKLQEMARIAEFLAITDAFVNEGLKFVSFKGPLLSQRLYGDATYRRYGDFDFLFDIPNAQIAIEILIKNGYSAVYYLVPEKDGQKKEFFRNIKEICFYNAAKDTNIEIHWKLFSGKFLPINKLNQIIAANLSQISFAGRNFTVLNPEFDLLYLVIHGGLHCFRRLKWLVDIKDFLDKVPIDVEKFQDLTKQLNASRLVALCNEVLKVYFPDSNLLPGNYRVNSFLVDYAIEKIESKTYENKKSFKESIRGYRYLLNAFPSWPYKLSVFQTIFFLSYVVQTKKTSCIPFAYIFIVPFQTILRLAKGPVDTTATPQNDTL
jgi:hypothetical protein